MAPGAAAVEADGSPGAAVVGAAATGRPQPPDIEEMLRRSQDKFKKFIPGSGGGGKIALLLLALAVLVWLATGLYRVQPGEEGVELLFGKFVQRTTPGLNYWFPAPIGQVFTPNVENTNVTTIGFREFGASDTKLYCPRRFRRKSYANRRSKHHRHRLCGAVAH